MSGAMPGDYFTPRERRECRAKLRETIRHMQSDLNVLRVYTSAGARWKKGMVGVIRELLRSIEQSAAGALQSEHEWRPKP